MEYICSYLSPLGEIILRSDGEVLTGLWFRNSHDDIKNVGEYVKGDLKIFDDTKRWLDIYFSGKNPDFTPKYCVQNLNNFKKKVYKIMERIPYGETLTYGDIAREIEKIDNKKMSAQAVGGAVGWNPICIIIPCHRVLGKDGKLTGYGGGIEKKIALLDLEKIPYKS